MLDERHPQRDEAQRLGCTCRWHGTGSILIFDAECPVLHRHRGPIPYEYFNLRLFDTTKELRDG